MLTDTFRHTVDAKGRLFIPTALRVELGESFRIIKGYPHRGLQKNCLAAFSKESWAKLEEKYEAMSREEKIRMRPIFSRSKEYELDPQGRILLPQSLREWAEISKNVAIVGAGDNVEIWDADAWDQIDALESTQDNIASLWEELDF